MADCAEKLHSTQGGGAHEIRCPGTGCIEEYEEGHTRDLLVKDNLRAVLPNDPQQLLALRLYMPPVLAADKPKERFVLPL